MTAKANKLKVSAREARRVGAKLGLDWARVDLDQFRRGLEVELEHGARDPETNVTNNDTILTGKIAWAHLKEFPDYYTRLAQMEAEADRYWALNSSPGPSPPRKDARNATRRRGGKKGTAMKTRILHISLVMALSFGATAVFFGCDRDDAKKGGTSLDNAANTTSDAVKQVIDKGAAGANTGINAAHDATTQAVDQARNATDTARTAVGTAAQKSGEAVNQAAQATRDFISPATLPTTAPVQDK